MAEVVAVAVEVVVDTAVRTTHPWEVAAGGKLLIRFEKKMVTSEIVQLVAGCWLCFISAGIESAFRCLPWRRPRQSAGIGGCACMLDHTGLFDLEGLCTCGTSTRLV